MKVVLHKQHRGEWKMVGKIFPLGSALILLHEESGTQRLHKLDAPGGFDVDALAFARRVGVSWVHHHQRSSPRVLICPLDRVLEDGIREKMDGRDRIFVPRALWLDRPFEYEVPWITTIKRIGEAAAEWKPIEKPKAPEGPPRLPGL